MKLDLVKPSIEMSGELQEKMFSIGDPGMIFDILRNKMYGNPILAICREISCNARDTHREVGTPDLPIEIQLPSGLDPYYKVRDFGLGISPDRIENIYIKYGVSSKRGDNVQVGSFGIGAKSPLAYTDSFTIDTVFNGIEYVYSVNIDETRVGKLVLLSEESTTKKNGTEIIIPVKSKNFNDFAMWTTQACSHWHIKPIIKGESINWPLYNKIVEGTGWAIIKSENYHKAALAVIDGIEYPLVLEVFE